MDANDLGDMIWRAFEHGSRINELNEFGSSSKEKTVEILLEPDLIPWLENHLIYRIEEMQEDVRDFDPKKHPVQVDGFKNYPAPSAKIHLKHNIKKWSVILERVQQQKQKDAKVLLLNVEQMYELDSLLSDPQSRNTRESKTVSYISETIKKRIEDFRKDEYSKWVGTYYSLYKCAFCKPIKERSYESTLLNVKSRGWGQYMNPSTCPYNYVKIHDKIYKRQNVPLDYRVDKPCYDCGVLYGGVHHVGCDSEECPICGKGNRLVSCGCAASKYYKGPTDSGVYKEIKEEKETSSSDIAMLSRICVDYAMKLLHTKRRTINIPLKPSLKSWLEDRLNDGIKIERDDNNIKETKILYNIFFSIERGDEKGKGKGKSFGIPLDSRQIQTLCRLLSARIAHISDKSYDMYNPGEVKKIRYILDMIKICL